MLNEPADLIQWEDIPQIGLPNLLDEDIPQIGLKDPMQPVQTPFPKAVSKPLEKLKQFGEWLFSYIPPKTKVLDAIFNALNQKVMSLYKKSFKVIEYEYALRGFTTKYTIEQGFPNFFRLAPPWLLE